MSDFSRVIFKPALQLDGPLLVEASAGTGKTYNIQNVFLRLILERGWTIQQILVVTFTNAATRELREQLRRALLECSRGLDMPAARRMLYEAGFTALRRGDGTTVPLTLDYVRAGAAAGAGAS